MMIALGFSLTAAAPPRLFGGQVSLPVDVLRLNGQPLGLNGAWLVWPDPVPQTALRLDGEPLTHQGVLITLTE
ncbi:hypothetical protein FDP22_22845 (plasmid) [Paroceanicella profunda]|uniref:Uncharacterized protein n=1 Tax=Paroceanicella profunda TaxID=2579971 RepID=A0A5B8G279_9RHOB|nr:hypothetical protein [Paroceanicella profunda]QDL94715.1 hypothetical protein FDP22_22845 [Paroceanicella profunda]